MAPTPATNSVTLATVFACDSTVQHDVIVVV